MVMCIWGSRSPDCRVPSAGSEPEISAHSPAVSEAGGILEGQDVGEGSEGTDAGDLSQRRSFGVALTERLELTVVAAELLVCDGCGR